MPTPFEKAVAQHQAGRPDQAEAILRRALASSSDQPRLESLLAMVLSVQGKHDQAAHFFTRALAGRPDSAALRTNFANMLLLTGQYAQAADHFREALRLDDRLPEAWLGLAPALHHLGDLDGAIDAARRAVDLAPTDPSSRLNLGSALSGAGYSDLAIDVLRAGLKLAPSNSRLLSNCLMTQHYLWGCTAQELLLEHRRLGQLLTGKAPPPPRSFSHSRDPARPLRIGILSADLRNHVVALFLRPLLEHRDRERFHLSAFNVGPSDRKTQELKTLVDRWHDALGLPDDALERRILAERIDILLDLGGHTEGSRIALMSRRLAPVQATYIGYPGTTGVPNIDYRIVDAITDPPGEDAATEKLIRLPRCFLAYTPPPDAPPITPRAAGPITFASFNAAPKINDTLLDLWGRLLITVPSARLLLKNRSLASPKRQAEVLARLASSGADPARIELVGWNTTFAEHLATYSRVDIALDSLPYHGTTTTCESLWMGVPVVTMAGSAHVSRVGASLLSAVGDGAADLISDNPDDYLRRAAALAADPPRLAALRASLRDRMASSPLCDGRGLTRAVQSAWRTMWQAWCESPAQP